MKPGMAVPMYSGMGPTWSLSDVDGDHLSDLWEHDGHLYRTVGWTDQPVVFIEDIATGERQTHVITSPNFGAYKRLRPEAPR